MKCLQHGSSLLTNSEDSDVNRFASPPIKGSYSVIKITRKDCYYKATVKCTVRVIHSELGKFRERYNIQMGKEYIICNF